MLPDFFIPLLAIGLAELGDKTQLAVFCLSSKTKQYIRLLLGVMLAFVVADGIAIVFGDLITRVVPEYYIKIAAGLVFLGVGVWMLIDTGEEEVSCGLKTPFISAFSLVLLSEMGDKTQIASALFATKYNPYLVFLGVILALLLLSVMAIYFGQILLAKIKKRTVSIIAGSLFVIIGIATLIGLA